MKRDTLIVILLLASAGMVVLWFGFQLVLQSGGPQKRDIVTSPPPVAADDPVRGSPAAAVTIVEFGDMQCPFCGSLSGVLERIVADYPDDVRIVWKDYFDEVLHPEALNAAVAARCAQAQGKFWEYHDLLFANSTLLSPTLYPTLARELSLDEGRFAACLAGPVPPVIGKGLEEGLERGITATPHLFVNSIQKSGTISYEDLVTLIRQQLLP